MSVLIKGMKMPKDCRECPMQTYSVETGKTWCLPADELLADNYRSIQFHVRPEWCPLVEVPTPHGRLIDADATMKQWGLNNATKYGNKTTEQQYFSYSTMMMYEIADILDDAPVVIEVEDE